MLNLKDRLFLILKKEHLVLIGIIIIYLGFGAGLSVFMFSGFVKSIPIDIEEAAMIDGCNPIQTFFLIVLPLLKPIVIFYLVCQKHIIEGVAAGAVKG